MRDPNVRTPPNPQRGWKLESSTMVKPRAIGQNTPQSPTGMETQREVGLAIALVLVRTPPNPQRGWKLFILG